MQKFLLSSALVLASIGPALAEDGVSSNGQPCTQNCESEEAGIQNSQQEQQQAAPEDQEDTNETEELLDTNEDAAPEDGSPAEPAYEPPASTEE